MRRLRVPPQALAVFSEQILEPALSSIASASSFFRRRFSSSSDFNRRASETSTPPYFAFHLIEIVFVAVRSHRQGDTRTDEVAKDLARDYLTEIGWFGEESLEATFLF